MRNLSEYQTFFFDCDGVILQSNHIKTQAFRQALQGESEALIDRFISYHQTHGGVSRYVKFAYFYEQIKKQPQSQLLIEQAIARYAHQVRLALITAPFVPGVEDFLGYLKKNNKRCFVISGGDQQELKEVFSQRNIDFYFEDIFGSPQTKQQHLEKMLQAKELVLPAIYFGDARADLDAALAYQIDFCFISGYSEWQDGLKVVPQMKLPVLADFCEIV